MTIKEPIEVLRKLAKYDPFLDTFLEDHIIPNIEIAQRSLSTMGLSLAVVFKKDIEGDDTNG
jgi:hypothetical protein